MGKTLKKMLFFSCLFNIIQSNYPLSSRYSPTLYYKKKILLVVEFLLRERTSLDVDGDDIRPQILGQSASGPGNGVKHTAPALSARRILQVYTVTYSVNY